MRLVVLSVIVLGLGGSSALATATAPAKSATISVIVVQRTGSVSPGATSPVSVLCPGKYTALSWGFQAITPVQGKLLALKYASAAPIVRKNGGLVGWIARFRNENAVPLGVRVGATCAQGTGIQVRTTSRAAAVAGAPPQLNVRTVTDTVTLKGPSTVKLGVVCPRGTVPVSASHELGAGIEIRADGPMNFFGGRRGWSTEFHTDESTTSVVRVTVVCIGAAGGPKVGMKGVGAALSGQILVDATGTHTLTVPAAGNSFFFNCLKGVNTDIAYQTAPVAGSVSPFMGAWFHRPVTGSETLDPKQRTIAFLGGGAQTTVALRALCLKTNGGFKVPKAGTIDLKLNY